MIITMAPVTKCALLVLATLTLLTDRAASESIFNQVKQTKTIISNDVIYMPKTLIIGKHDGTILRCPEATPNSCEVYYTGNSTVTATVIHGEFLFASLASGAMLRCHWHKTQSCAVFHQADSKMVSLAVASGFIYAGLRSGTIMRCELNTPHNCHTFVNTGSNIASIAAVGSFIYVGSGDGNGRIDRCSISESSCSKFCSRSGGEVVGLAAIGDTIYGLREGGYILSAQNVCNECSLYSIPDGSYISMGVNNKQFYGLRATGQIRITHPITQATSVYVQHENAESISFAYGTYAMQSRYQMESKKCIWRGVFKCPPTVFYYGVENRLALEVSVKNGSLYDSQGALVDTSDADGSYSQNAAIFVMGPDGQILLSNVHKTGLLHTSSLLAGNPVSGGGLIVVEHGKIRNMTACSVHYRPDLELNNQVIESLYMKGYTDPIDSHVCTYSDVMCWADNSSQYAN